jgi:four helix bundle protein
MSKQDQNSKGQGSNGRGDPGSVREPYENDLSERCARFGEAIIAFAKKVPVKPLTVRLIPQLVGSGTSSGANYDEANNCESRRDFKHEVSIGRKESREAKYWIRMIVSAVPELKDEGRPLWQEAKELNLIFSAMFQNARRKLDGENGRRRRL